MSHRPLQWYKQVGDHRTMSSLSHYHTADSIDKLLSVSCSRPRPKGTNPFLFACVLAGNDVWWRWWSQAQGRVSEGQILSVALPPSFSFFSLYWLFHDTSFCFFFFPISISPFSVILSFSVLYYFLSSSRSRFPAQAPELDPWLVITLVLAGVHLTRRVPAIIWEQCRALDCRRQWIGAVDGGVETAGEARTGHSRGSVSGVAPVMPDLYRYYQYG